MMTNFNKITRVVVVGIVLALFLSTTVLSVVFANQDADRLQDINSKIKEYEEKIAEAQGKQRTLASTIAVLDGQINLTAVRIEKTEAEVDELEKQIEELSKKIVLLDTNLDATTEVFHARIQETYKKSFLPSLYLLISNSRFFDFFSQVKYLKTAQAHDMEVLYQMEEAKQNYDIQKALKEEKQEELEKLQTYLQNQQNILNQQKAAKKDLLTATRNDEAKFQQLLAQARAEFEAIQAILAGRGAEEEVKEVKAGDTIASVIVGSSCNSSGTHLHFTVAQNGNALNPFSYLRGADHENCSGPGACSEGDPFNPSGSWEWPVPPKIRMNQGYGSTWAVKNTWVGQIYSFHNGIDIIGSSNTIKAVQDGTLYRGSYGGGGGCRLRYVRVDHKDSDLETFYLHVNY